MTEWRHAAVLSASAEPVTPAEPKPHRRLPRHRAYVVWAIAGTVLALTLLLLDVRASGHGILRPIRAGAKGPSAAVIAKDFPKAALPDEVGLDGQQFYAIARDPFHPEAVAPNLDDAQYRYQRPLYPALAWLLHPQGGGPGLVWALTIVSLFGLLVGALAMGALSRYLRAPPWLALLYPVLPGAVWTVTSSVADGLAVSLCLLTIVATLRGRSGLAVIAATAAVLTRETTILVPVALLLARRRKEDLPLLVVPALVIAAWLMLVHVSVPSGGIPPERLWWPVTGLFDAARTKWLHGKELLGMASTLSALVAGVFVLIRGWGPSELRWVIGVQMGFLAVCSGDVLGNDFGGTRSTLMLLALAVAVLMSGTRAPDPTYLASTGARNRPV